MLRLRASLLVCIIMFVALSWIASATSVDVVTYVDQDKANRVVERARDYLGTPYVYAGESKRGVDCSGLVYCVYQDVFGDKLPRRVADLLQAGGSTSKGLVPGDLVFFDTTGGPSHVGIYIGDREFIHAASEGPRTGVIVSSLEEEYYKRRYIGARRYINGSILGVRVSVDDQRAVERLSEVLQPKVPLHFSIENALMNTRWFTLNVFQDDMFVLSKRIKAKNGSDPSKLWFYPSSGSWTVTIEDEDNRRLLKLNFTSRGKQ
jgi:hypothetical protein